MSIYRYNIPAGGGAEIRRPERATVRVEVEPGRYDLSADRKALEILRGVRQRGVERFVLFANSPPGRLTRNGLTSGGEGGGSNLRPGEEEAFAEYLVELAMRVRDECGLPDVALSPVNEPQWKWGENRRSQEGCHYTPAEAAVVVRKVVEVAERRKAGLRIEAPESGAWEGTAAYAKEMFADPVIAAHVGEIAIHSYWSDRAAKERAAAVLRERFPDKRLAMSEYCEMKPGTELGIDSGLELAGVIHDDLTIGNVVSWQWWLGVGPGGYRDALIYAHPKTQKVDTTKRLWVLGQYSRFVRPGFVRVGAEARGGEIRATAFVSSEGKRLVCVLINPTGEAVPVAVQTPGFEGRESGLYVTDETRDLAKVERAGEMVLPARSVSTLVFDR